VFLKAAGQEAKNRMTFNRALSKLKQGYEIKRKKWIGDVKIILRDGSVLFITNGKIDLRPVLLRDLEARDWEIIDREINF
jgi:hypothetical protein